MKLRRLNRAGIEEWSRFLDSLDTDSPAPYPSGLLQDPGCSYTLADAVDMEQKDFWNRYEFAAYLNQRLSHPQPVRLEHDVGLWTWLAAFYFDLLCPVDKRGRRKPGQRARWIYTPSFRRYYLHLVAGPFMVYRSYKDDPQLIFPLLAGAPGQISTLYRELAARQELLTNRAVLEVVNRLYADPGGTGLKPGVTNRDAPGTITRLIDVLVQFDATWDLCSIDADTLYMILPEEFDRFR